VSEVHTVTCAVYFQIIKICSFLTNVQTKISWLLFMAHGVERV